jgi:hypothetical protein
MRTRFTATVLLAGALVAAQGPRPPQIGFVSDGNHNFRPIFGISGTFWLGNVVAVDVVSAASSGNAAIFKTQDHLRVLDSLGHPLGHVSAAFGPALFAFSSTGAPALAWLPDSGELLRWNGVQFERMPGIAASLDGSVVSLAAPNSSTAAFVVRRDRQLWRVDISLLDGGVVFAANLPGVSAPVLLFDDGTLLYQGHSALVVRNPQGVERSIAFAGAAVQFIPMGQDWMLIESSRPPNHLGLRLSTGALFELPEVSQ